MDNQSRKEEHQKNYELEAVFQELEMLLKGCGEEQQFTSKHPIIFIMGCARSGSTLLLQYLSSHEQFCYPTNLLSRFYYAPYVGALIQKMLYDLDEKQELLKYFNHDDLFESKLGKTKGILSPHEFWYYWKRYFQFDEIQRLSEEEVRRTDWEGFTNGLYAIMNVFNKPLVLKGMMLNWNIEDLAIRIPNAYFIHIRRETSFNAQSLLIARKNFFGSYENWYSFKPPEYKEIVTKPYWEQVIDQVHYTNQAIERGLGSISSDRYISLSYEDFCTLPSETLNGFLSGLGMNFNLEKISFSNSSEISIDREIWKAMSQYDR